MGDCGRRDACRTGDVRVEDLPPRLAVDVDEASQRADGRGVDERLDPAESGRRVGDRRAARVVVRHVTADRQSLRTGLASSGFEAIPAPRQHRHMRASLGEPDPDAATEPTRRSDDHGSHFRPPDAMTQMLDTERSRAS